MSGQTEVKMEIPEGIDLESKVIELCQQFPKGISDAIIQNAVPESTQQERVFVINTLLSAGKINLLKSGNQLIYKLKDETDGNQVKGGDQQEKLVYQTIKEAGNKGIWIRDIRFKTNIILPQVNKILKNLENKKLIKAVKSVAASRRKMYMLFELEPDRSVTGGAWYSDQDFESEFVDVLNQQAFKFLQQKAAAATSSGTDPVVQFNSSFASSLDVCKFISELGISKVQLGVEDIETILNTLIYDGKVEKSVVAKADGQTNLYRAVPSLIEPTGLMRMPCGSCPVFDQCYEGGVVSPTTCIYMSDWFDDT